MVLVVVYLMMFIYGVYGMTVCDDVCEVVCYGVRVTV